MSYVADLSERFSFQSLVVSQTGMTSGAGRRALRVAVDEGLPVRVVDAAGTAERGEAPFLGAVR